MQQRVLTIVKDRSRVDVARELPLDVREERRVNLLLLGREVVSSDDERSRRETEVVRSLDLGSSEHHSVEQELELLPSLLAKALVRAELDDRVEDLILRERRQSRLENDCNRKHSIKKSHVPEADVRGRVVTALIAVGLVAELPVEGLSGEMDRKQDSQHRCTGEGRRRQRTLQGQFLQK